MSRPLATCELPPGTVTQVNSAFPVVPTNNTDPRNAMALALVRFLECATFTRWGGPVADDVFALESVEQFWPDADKELCYPSASVIDAAQIPYEAHSFTPTILEDTFEQFCPGTVLWKTAEAVASFQVEFWSTNDPTREAIAARLPSLFNPTEIRTGVLLSGDERYFCAPVRATLMSQQRVDTPELVYSRERRLMTIIKCEIDVLHLRAVNVLLPRVTLLDGSCAIPTEE